MAIENRWNDIGMAKMPELPRLPDVAVQVARRMPTQKVMAERQRPIYLLNINDGLAGLSVDKAPTGLASQPVEQRVSQTPKIGLVGMGKAPISAAQPYMSLFEAASKQYGVPLPHLLAVAQTESDFRPNLTSPTGVKGIMQVTQDTYNGLGFTGDRTDPANSINAGAKLLSQLFKKYNNWDDAFYAYNGGHHAVTGIRNNNWGVWSNSPGKIREIQNYAPKVNRYLQQWNEYFG